MFTAMAASCTARRIISLRGHWAAGVWAGQDDRHHQNVQKLLHGMESQG
jgi:hypothetical protein